MEKVSNTRNNTNEVTLKQEYKKQGNPFQEKGIIDKQHLGIRIIL